jgi:hypothetical protein
MGIGNFLKGFTDIANKALDNEAKKSGEPRGDGFYVTNIKEVGDLPPLTVDEYKEKTSSKSKK